MVAITSSHVYASATPLAQPFAGCLRIQHARRAASAWPGLRTVKLSQCGAARMHCSGAVAPAGLLQQMASITRSIPVWRLTAPASCGYPRHVAARALELISEQRHGVRYASVPIPLADLTAFPEYLQQMNGAGQPAPANDVPGDQDTGMHTLFLGRPFVRLSKDVCVRIATSSDDDCMFLAGCLDSASHGSLRGCWGRLATDAGIDADGDAVSTSCVISGVDFADLEVHEVHAAGRHVNMNVDHAYATNADAGAGTAEYTGQDSGTFLNSCQRVIQRHESSWYHHRNAIILCDASGARLVGMWIIVARRLPAFQSVLDGPDAKVFEDLLFSLVNQRVDVNPCNEDRKHASTNSCTHATAGVDGDDFDSRNAFDSRTPGGHDRFISSDPQFGYMFGAGSSLRLNMQHPQLDKFRGATMKKMFPYLGMSRLLQSLMEWHEMAGLTSISFDTREMLFHHGLGLKETFRVQQPMCGDVLVGPYQYRLTLHNKLNTLASNEGRLGLPWRVCV